MQLFIFRNVLYKIWTTRDDVLTDMQIYPATEAEENIHHVQKLVTKLDA